MKKQKKEGIWQELKEHIPFTALATAIAIIIVGFVPICRLEISVTFFEFAHPLHVIFSGLATTAIFYKYKKQKINAVIIGILGAILIGSLSDIILPWLGSNMIALNTHFHLPIIEEPVIILGAALVGSIVGLSFKESKISHFAHVLLSVVASLFYIVTFSTNLNAIYLIAAFFIVFVAVIVPCCLSDIIFPFLFIRKKRK